VKQEAMIVHQMPPPPPPPRLLLQEQAGEEEMTPRVPRKLCSANGYWSVLVMLRTHHNHLGVKGAQALVAVEDRTLTQDKRKGWHS